MTGCECCDNFSMIDGGDEFKAFPGLKGDDGTTFYPHVSAEGILSWTNDGGKPNPDPVNIKGTDGKSAYQAAVEAGFSGTEAEFNTYLSGIGNLTDLVDRKAGALVDTASGAIASFVPDSTIDNLLGLEVAVEPVQDLHGQTSPWPAGGGKNLYNANAINYLSSNGVTVTVSNGTITLNGTATANAFFSVIGTGLPSGNYAFSFNNPVASSDVRVSLRNSGGQYFSDIAADAVNKSLAFTGEPTDILLYVKSGATMTNFVVKPQLETGSTPTAWTPYENLCPISGWDAVGIGNSASNLIDASAVANGFLQPTDGAVYDNQNWNVTPFIPARGGDYTLSWESAVSTYQGTICAYDQDQHYITGVNWSGGAYSHTFTLPFGTSYLRASWFVVVSGNPAVRNNIRLNFGGANLGYTPFVTGNTYTITLGQTVYGGTLDAVAGKLTVDRKYFSYSSAQHYGNYGTWNKPLYYVGIPDAQTTRIKPCYTVGQPPLKCNYFNSTTGVNSDTLGNNEIRTQETDAPTRFYFRADGFADLNAVNAALTSTPLQVVAYLVTPIEITLDPVTISTIANQINNVWADAGDVDVTYAADLKAYIDRLNQPTEDDMIANSLIAANKYFTVNNRLFLSTASIAAGAQIIPGTNCTETSLVEALNALNA